MIESYLYYITKVMYCFKMCLEGRHNYSKLLWEYDTPSLNLAHGLQHSSSFVKPRTLCLDFPSSIVHYFSSRNLFIQKINCQFDEDLTSVDTFKGSILIVQSLLQTCLRLLSTLESYLYTICAMYCTRTGFLV